MNVCVWGRERGRERERWGRKDASLHHSVNGAKSLKSVAFHAAEWLQIDCLPTQGQRILAIFTRLSRVSPDADCTFLSLMIMLIIYIKPTFLVSFSLFLALILRLSPSNSLLVSLSFTLRNSLRVQELCNCEMDGRKRMMWHWDNLPFSDG